MIDHIAAAKIAVDLGVSPEVVLMEAYQMLILDGLASTPFSKNLVFKGGTCLRLAHQSFRFSEDLDFSMLKPITFLNFKRGIEIIVNKYPEIRIEDIFDMKQTLFAKLIISVMGKKVGIKIEISKRKEPWRRENDYKLRLLQSSTSGLNPLIYSATLERIYSDKLTAVKNRKKPRDWFDLWFLSQKLNKKWRKRIPLSRKLMLDRVRFLLPKSKRLILEEFQYEN
ncbi:nucleotidyl transferase AbiEii/AbiGii toxin family protein [Candidatus Collierbacteria bacterium]|nr:nucleotidyl transferase AbiEii/AbiGii toxin family protein [Candidatus Collierbacteria bacterium]